MKETPRMPSLRREVTASILLRGEPGKCPKQGCGKGKPETEDLTQIMLLALTPSPAL